MGSSSSGGDTQRNAVF